jgi:ubiquinone/menaquinone biosynthesis C-methylase UbiE
MAGTAQPVEWRQADAMQLPFDNAMFDAVVCQCGVMFFPDKPRAFAEALRVLRRAARCCSTYGTASKTTSFPIP